MGSLILSWWNLPSTKWIWLNRSINLSLHLFHFLEQVYVQTWNVTEISIYELKCHQSQSSQATANKMKPLPQSCIRTAIYLILKVLIFGMHLKHTYRAHIWDKDLMKKYMRFSYPFVGIFFRTDDHRGHFELENRLNIVPTMASTLGPQLIRIY